MVCWLVSVVGSAAQPVEVLVSVPPHAGFVDTVGGDRVKVRVLIPPGQNPHTYTPTAQQVGELVDVQIYFRTGMPFESWLLPRLQALVTDLQVVDLREGLPLHAIDPHDHGHDHHHGADHTLDPHIWLNPLLAKQQVAVIRDTLIAVDPAGRSRYERHAERLINELETFHQGLLSRLAPSRGRAFLVYHPAYGYFADCYGLEQVAVEHRGQQPTARHLAQVIDRARRERLKVIVVQPQFSRRHAETVAAAIDGTLVVADPMARDYRAGLEQLSRAIEQATQ